MKSLKAHNFQWHGDFSCQIYLNNNTDIPKCKWSRKCWGFLFWTLTSFTSHQSSSSIWLPDKWFFSRHHLGLDFKIGHFFELCSYSIAFWKRSGSHQLVSNLWQIFFISDFKDDSDYLERNHLVIQQICLHSIFLCLPVQL